MKWVLVAVGIVVVLVVVYKIADKLWRRGMRRKMIPCPECGKPLAPLIRFYELIQRTGMNPMGERDYNGNFTLPEHCDHCHKDVRVQIRSAMFIGGWNPDGTEG